MFMVVALKILLGQLPSKGAYQGVGSVPGTSLELGKAHHTLQERALCLRGGQRGGLCLLCGQKRSDLPEASIQKVAEPASTQAWASLPLCGCSKHLLGVSSVESRWSPGLGSEKPGVSPPLLNLSEPF